jgi:hypothetical protein
MGYSRDEWIELASSAGFPSLLDPASGYTGQRSTSLLDPSAGYTGGSLLDPSAGYTGGKSPGRTQAARSSSSAGSGSRRSRPGGRPTHPSGKYSGGGRSPARPGRTHTAERQRLPLRSSGQYGYGGAASSVGGIAQRPLVRSRLNASLDAAQLGGATPLYSSGPLQPLPRGPTQPPPSTRPGTSPAHLALESQVSTALEELGGLDTAAVLEAPPATAGPRQSTTAALASESEVVQRLRDQLRQTDAVVQKLHQRTHALQEQVAQLEGGGQPQGASDEGGRGEEGTEQAQALRQTIAEQEAFISELQGQLVATVQQHEVQVNAAGQATAAELTKLRAELAAERKKQESGGGGPGARRSGGGAAGTISAS